MMARTKQTPRNPNINRLKTAIGSDVQEGRPTLRPALSKTPVKGGKQPQKHLSWKLLYLGATPTGGIKKNPPIQAWNGGFKRDKEIPKINRVSNKEISISKINSGRYHKNTIYVPRVLELPQCR